MMNKANHLVRSCGAQVYFIALFHGQYYIYSSYKNGGWPLSEHQIVYLDKQGKIADGKSGDDGFVIIVYVYYL